MQFFLMFVYINFKVDFSDNCLLCSNQDNWSRMGLLFICGCNNTLLHELVEEFCTLDKC